ncbi:unnamed protein product, partial [Ranitomeya imitator]
MSSKSNLSQPSKSSLVPNNAFSSMMEHLVIKQRSLAVCFPHSVTAGRKVKVKAQPLCSAFTLRPAVTVREADGKGPDGHQNFNACNQGKHRFIHFATFESLLALQPVDTMCKKREDYLEWCEYFMAVAFLSAQRSKDPSSQVGACIVNPENKIVGIGYNGMPNGCHDDVLPWARTASDRLDTKYPYVCHAELNAIMNKNSADVKGCIMYVALFPCNECAKLIIQAGTLQGDCLKYLGKLTTDLPWMSLAQISLFMLSQTESEI